MKSFPQDWAGGNWGWTKDTRLPGTAGLLGVEGGTRIWVQPQVPQQRLCPPAPTEQRIQGAHRKQEMGKELRGDTPGKGSLLCFPRPLCQNTPAIHIAKSEIHAQEYALRQTEK